MLNIQSNLDRFNREATSLQQALTSWHDELSVKEKQQIKEAETIKRQRDELIQKSNLIVQQVNGLRGQKEKADQKMLEAEKLKKSAVEQLEQVENMKSDSRLKENELEYREKNLKLLEEREKKVKEDEKRLNLERENLESDRELLKKEQEMLDEKQQVLLIRERKLDIKESKQKRLVSDL